MITVSGDFWVCSECGKQRQHLGRPASAFRHNCTNNQAAIDALERIRRRQEGLPERPNDCGCGH